jgi:hypothetical protein
MSIEELLEMAAEYNWEIQYDVDGQLIFFTGVRDESKRVDPLAYEGWDDEDIVDEFLT